MLKTRSRQPRWTPRLIDSTKPGSGRATKTAALLALLGRPRGASASELARLSGWKATTVRGWLSAVRKRKGADLLRSVTPSGQSRYRLVVQQTQEG